jgi:hypothetical protein
MMIGVIIGLTPHAYSAYYPNPAFTFRFICKVRGYACQSLAMMDRWLMAMGCIDRYMASSNNFSFHKYSNPRMANVIITIIVIIWSILPVHNLIFLELKAGVCLPSSTAIAAYHSYFTFIFGGFLPLTTMIISAILIRRNLASRRKRRQRSIRRRNEDPIVRLLGARDHQVLIILFIQVAFYILSIIPWMVFLLYFCNSGLTQNKSADRVAIELFIMYVAEIIVFMYPSLSFYIYTLTSHTFRSELVNTIRALLINKDRSQHDSRPSLLQSQVPLESELKQSKKIYYFQLMGIEKFLDSSSKNDPSLEQIEENSLISDSSPASIPSIH